MQKRTEPMSTEKKYVPLLLKRSAATEKDKKLRPLKLPLPSSQKQYVPLLSKNKKPISLEKIRVPLQSLRSSDQAIQLSLRTKAGPIYHLAWTDEDNPPPLWKGFWGGEAKIVFDYETEIGQYVNVRIGNSQTGKVYYRVRCSTSHTIPVTIVVASGGHAPDGDDIVPNYDSNLWENVNHAGDAFRHVAIAPETTSPILIKSISVVFNGITIAERSFPLLLPASHDKPLYLDSVISDFCWTQVLFNSSMFLKTAKDELSKSWKPEYGCDWEYDYEKGRWGHPAWCGEFIKWVLEKTLPSSFHDLPSSYVKYWFFPRSLCISPYVERIGRAYNGMRFDDWYPHLGDYIKPGFLVNTPAHITMFVMWCDKYLRPVKFDPRATPQYMLCIGGQQGGRVTTMRFGISKENVSGADIVWKRRNQLQPLDSMMQEGFSDPNFAILHEEY
jgi:hypothetical protein